MVGPYELVMLVVIAVTTLLPLVASAVFLWLVFQGRFSPPKSCPKCGADLEESDQA